MKAEKKNMNKWIALFVIGTMVLGGVAYAFNAYLKKEPTTTDEPRTLNLEEAINVGKQHIKTRPEYIGYNGGDIIKVFSLEQPENNNTYIISYEFDVNPKNNQDIIKNGKATLIIKQGIIEDGAMLIANSTELNASNEYCLNSCGDGYCEQIRVKQMYFPCKENNTICPEDCKDE